MEIERLEKSIGIRVQRLSLDEIIKEGKRGYILDDNENIIAIGLYLNRFQIPAYFLSPKPVHQ